ncbi:MAG TPA: hypothetical protein VFC82_04030 [Actinomycetaceae bacterium]|nr:hypothetical protein [Actinomycetaceae bacterium]
MRALFGGRAEAREAPPAFDRALITELDLAYVEIENDCRPDLDQRLYRRLVQSAARGAPIRRLETAPVHGVVRVRLADGLAVLARPLKPGDFARLSVALLQGATALVNEVRITDKGVRIVASFGKRDVICAHVLGFDQQS